MVLLRILIEDVPKTSKATASNVLDSFRRRAIVRVQANQAHFHLVLNQLAMERVTAGGYCPEHRQPRRKENGNGNEWSRN